MADALSALIRAEELVTLQKRLAELSSFDLLTAPDADLHTPLHWAALSPPSFLAAILPHISFVDPISNSPVQSLQTPLHWACVSGPLRNVQALLAAGADPAHRDAKGYNAALHAAQYGRVPILHLLLTAHPPLLETVDNEGHALLHWAAYYNHHPATVYLLHSNAPDPPDSLSMTALHRAAARDATLVAEALLRAGADFNARDSRNRTPARLARGHLLRLMQLWSTGLRNPASPVGNRLAPSKFALVAFYWVNFALSAVALYDLQPDGVLAGFYGVCLYILMLLSGITHLFATMADPGDIQKGDKNGFFRYIDDCITDDTADVLLLPTAYCFTCLTPRLPRSKHSRERDVCVRLFDHECPWINNAVALRTHKTFIVLALSTAVSETLYLGAIARLLLYAPRSWIATFAIHPLPCLMAIVHIVIAIFSYMLFGTHVLLVAKGRTTYEQMVATREKVLTNSYDRGVWTNCVSFWTSSGPGTGRPLSKLSFRVLRDVVLGNNSQPIQRRSQHKEESRLLEET